MTAACPRQDSGFKPSIPRLKSQIIPLSYHQSSIKTERTKKGKLHSGVLRAADSGASSSWTGTSHDLCLGFRPGPPASRVVDHTSEPLQNA